MRAISAMKYNRNVAHGIMFHHLHGGRHPKSQGSISADELDQIIRFVGRERILDPCDWMERVEHHNLRDDDLCLTFDDGLLCQFEIALPVLERHNLRAFWFVYSSVFDGHVSKFEVYRAFRTTCFGEVEEFYDLFFAKVLNSEFSAHATAVLNDNEVARRQEAYPFYSIADIRFRLVRDCVLRQTEYDGIMQEIMMGRGFTLTDLAEHLWMSDDNLRHLINRSHIVGLHSYSHPMLLGEKSFEEQYYEYARNFEHLTTIGCRPRSIAYPAGSYNADTLTILRSMGISCGFRSTMSSANRNGREGACDLRGRAGIEPALLELPREDHSNLLRLCS
jgi:peptidoglycan/xylan/chitin deacetylase (PgdA/CDA1 family)